MTSNMEWVLQQGQRNLVLFLTTGISGPYSPACYALHVIITCDEMSCQVDYIRSIQAG